MGAKTADQFLVLDDKFRCSSGLVLMAEGFGLRFSTSCLEAQTRLRGSGASCADLDLRVLAGSHACMLPATRLSPSRRIHAPRPHLRSGQGPGCKLAYLLIL